MKNFVALTVLALVLLMAPGAFAQGPTFIPPNAIGNVEMPVAPATLASAASLVPTGAMQALSGTTSCTLIAIPYYGWTGVIIFIPAGAAPFATGGTQSGLSYPIGAAFTATANIPVIATFNGTSWYLK